MGSAEHVLTEGGGAFLALEIREGRRRRNPCPIDGREIPMSERLVPVNGKEVRGSSSGQDSEF